MGSAFAGLARRLPARPNNWLPLGHRVKAEGARRWVSSRYRSESRKTSRDCRTIFPSTALALDSPCFGIRVARLDDVTGWDPLGEAQVELSPNTIGGFTAPYEVALV
jgi:hypothetical protein